MTLHLTHSHLRSDVSHLGLALRGSASDLMVLVMVMVIVIGIGVLEIVRRVLLAKKKMPTSPT